MFFFRKIAKTLRGGAKPYQVLTATILGAMIGFAPPFMHGPLWVIALVLLLAIINANLFIATFTAGVAKIASMALVVVSFEIGMLMVDGPLQGTYQKLINAPVTALLGLDYYVTSGGAVLAIVLGAIWGMVVVRGLRIFRTRMAKIEQESEKYADWATKKWVRALCWVFFGGKAKQSYADLLEQRKIGNPVRIPGVIFAVLVVALLFIVQQFAAGPIVTWYAKDGLERFNGATVDLEGVELDLAEGKLTIARLAMADANTLDQDIFRAHELSADISGSDLLRKRMTIDLILVDDATSGEKRKIPGLRIGDKPKQPEPQGQGKTLEEWFALGQEWKERLETYRDWYEKIKGPPKEEDEGGIRGRARDIANRYGYANVRATHLIEGSPTLLVKEIRINKLRSDWPPGETLDIYAENISTQPAFAPGEPRVVVGSSAQSFDADFTLAPRAWLNATNKVALHLRNQSVDQTLSSLDIGSQTTVTDGTWQAGLDGNWSDTKLELPLVLELKGSKLALPGIDPMTIESLPLMFGVTGTVASPRLDLDERQLMQSLKDAGATALANAYLNKGGQMLRDELDKNLGSELGGQVNDLLQGLRRGNTGSNSGNGNADDKAPEEEPGIGIGNGQLLDRLRRSRENPSPPQNNDNN